MAPATAAVSASALCLSASAMTRNPSCLATSVVRGPIVIAGQVVVPPRARNPRTAEPDAKTTAARSASRRAACSGAAEDGGPSIVRYAVSSSTAAPRSRKRSGRSGAAAEALTSQHTLALDVRQSISRGPARPPHQVRAQAPDRRRAAPALSQSLPPPIAGPGGNAGQRGVTPAALVMTTQSYAVKSGLSEVKRLGADSRHRVDAIAG